jgi:hypothetical protein
MEFNLFASPGGIFLKVTTFVVIVELSLDLFEHLFQRQSVSTAPIGGRRWIQVEINTQHRRFRARGTFGQVAEQMWLKEHHRSHLLT